MIRQNPVVSEEGVLISKAMRTALKPINSKYPGIHWFGSVP